MIKAKTRLNCTSQLYISTVHLNCSKGTRRAHCCHSERRPRHKDRFWVYKYSVITQSTRDTYTRTLHTQNTLTRYLLHSLTLLYSVTDSHAGGASRPPPPGKHCFAGSPPQAEPPRNSVFGDGVGAAHIIWR